MMPSPQEHSPAWRLAKLLSEYGARGRTLAELADELEITQRTLHRCRKALEADGALFEETRERVTTPKRLVLLHLPNWEDLVTRDEAVALELASQVLQGGGAEAWAKALGNLRRLTSKGDTKNALHERETLARRIVLRAPSTDALAPDPMAFETIVNALRSSEGSAREVLLTYRTAKGDHMDGVPILPDCLCYDSIFRLALLLAWDPATGRPVFFRLSRILAAELGAPTLLDARARASLDRVREFQIGGLFEDRPPFRVRVRLTGIPWVQGLMDAPPSLPDFDLRWEKPGNGSQADSAIVDFMATEFKAPCRWILQFGPDAEVLEPPELRALVVQRVTQSAAMYAGMEERPMADIEAHPKVRPALRQWTGSGPG